MIQSNNKVKMPLVFKVGALLLLAMIFSLHLLGGVYARYTVTASGSDSARVAKFSFNADLSPQSLILPITLSPGESLDQLIEIENSGEASLIYVVTITKLTDNLPILRPEGEYDKNAPITTVIKSAVIAPSESYSVPFSIVWDKNDNSTEFMGKMDAVKITVSVEQAN